MPDYESPLHTVAYGPYEKSTCLHAIIFRTVCGADVVTLPPKFGGPEILVVHRVVSRERSMEVLRMGTPTLTPNPRAIPPLAGFDHHAILRDASPRSSLNPGSPPPGTGSPGIHKSMTWDTQGIHKSMSLKSWDTQVYEP